MHFRSIKTVNCQGSLMEKTWMPQAGCGSFAVPATKPNKTCLLSNISEKCFIVLSKKFFLGKKCWYGMTKNTHSTLESLHSYLIWETLCLKVRNKNFFFACLPWTPHSPYAIKHVQVSSHQSGHSRILNKIWKLLREGQVMPLFPTIFNSNEQPLRYMRPFDWNLVMIVLLNSQPQPWMSNAGVFVVLLGYFKVCSADNHIPVLIEGSPLLWMLHIQRNSNQQYFVGADNLVMRKILEQELLETLA